jgi:hypothetical protein
MQTSPQIFFTNYGKAELRPSDTSSYRALCRQPFKTSSEIDTALTWMEYLS